MNITENTEGLFYKDGTRYDITREEGDVQKPYTYGIENGYILYEDFQFYQEVLSKREERLPFFKANKLKEISDACKNEYTGDLTSSDGFVFSADVEAIIDIQLIIAALPPLGVFEGYKCVDDQFYDITREQFETALNDGITRKITAFAKRKVLAESVNNASTVDEVLAIVW